MSGDTSSCNDLGHSSPGNSSVYHDPAPPHQPRDVVQIPPTPSTSVYSGFEKEQLPSIDSLPIPLVAELCAIWFDKHHPWFPILHQPTVTQSLNHLTNLASSTRCLLFQAILAVTLQDSTSLSLTPSKLRQWQDHLSSSITLGVMNLSTLDALQAGLILSHFHYGERKIMSSWNMLAVCRRYVYVLTF